MRRRVGLFGIICLMTLGIVVGGVAISNVSALSYQSNIGVGFTFNPTLSVSLSNSDLVINNLSPNTSSDSNIITVNIATNATYGYDLFSTVGNTTNATTELKNGNNSFASLSSNVVTLASFDDNKWGYSYSTDSGSSWVSGDYGSTSAGYAGLPLYTGTGVKLASADDNADSTVQFKIAAKAGATQASGAYTNVVNFMAVSKVAPMSLLDAFMASGAEQINGYYKMQDMTSSICNAVDNSLIPSELQLIDERDNKLYWVAKLADGNCWMTQNLDLDLDSTAAVGSPNALTSENTNLKIYGSDGYDSNNGYSCSNTQTTDNCTASGEVITWVPARTTVTSMNSSNFPNIAAANSTSYSYNPGDRYYYPSVSGDDIPYTLAECEAQGHIDCAHYKAGNYYNWSASVASNNTSFYVANNANAGNSICSKGWRLPKKSTNEFQSLATVYNITAANAINLRNSPLYFVRSGGVRGGSLGNPGVSGYYWFDMVYDGDYAHYLYFSTRGFSPDGSDDRYVGFSVRCVAE